jgi:hypothetical protein
MNYTTFINKANKIILLIAFSLFSNNIIGQNEAYFSVEQLKSDLIFLRKKLERNHPNLYLYSPKSAVDSVYMKRTTEGCKFLIKIKIKF